ncbi:MAG: hypothetical protein ACOX9C_01745 [Kiritimatiellia bacterium]|jgi:hypothetical protein
MAKRIHYVTKSRILGDDEVACADLLEQDDVERLLAPMKSAIVNVDAARKHDVQNALDRCEGLKRQLEAEGGALSNDMAEIRASLKRRDGELEAYRDKMLRAIREETQGRWKADVEKTLAPHFKHLAEQIKALAEERAALEAQGRMLARQSETIQAIARYFVEAFRSDLDARESELTRAKRRVETLVSALAETRESAEPNARMESSKTKGKRK